jgi:hypothetical protein
MSLPPDDDGSEYYAFEPERFLIPPMEGFLRRILGARWGLILVSAAKQINLPTILDFLANFSLQQVYYFEKLEGERRKLRTIEDVLDEARDAVANPPEQLAPEPEPESEVTPNPLMEGVTESPLPRTPDLVFIPELEGEIVPSAVESAMTGHLVVSGIRAEGSFPALQSFIELVGSEHLAAASLMGILGLNTVARICKHCKVRVEYELGEQDIILIGGKERVLTGYKGMGCESCGGTGYHGRILIHEGFEMMSEIRSAILKGTPPRSLRILAKRNGMTTLLDAAWALAEAGETSLDEVVRIADVTDPGRL